MVRGKNLLSGGMEGNQNETDKGNELVERGAMKILHLEISYLAPYIYFCKHQIESARRSSRGMCE